MSTPHETIAKPTRGDVGVVLLAPRGEDRELYLATLRERTPSGVPVVAVDATVGAINEAIAALAPADVVIFIRPALVAGDWLGTLARAARADTNIGTASALSETGGALSSPSPKRPLTKAASADRPSARDDDTFGRLAQSVAERSLRLRPRLSQAVGPCVYVRREAIEAVGELDASLGPNAAIEVDFAQRCRAAGLANVAADDVVVRPLGDDDAVGLSDADPATLAERYPYLSETPLAQSDTLGAALLAAFGASESPSVTIDARILDGGRSGTQLHIIEMIRALATRGEAELRVLVHGAHIDSDTLALLNDLPDTEVLRVEDVTDGTPRSAVFHRPLQAFSLEDIGLASTLGERLVLNQLDLIAYDNPTYFADASAWTAYRRSARRGLAAADRVVVFSAETRNALLAEGLVDPERVRVIPPGLDHLASSESRRPPGLEPDQPFLLCLGADYRHKNRLFALRLFDELIRRHAWHGTLVLAGPHVEQGSSRTEERDLLEARPELAQRVSDLGPVAEAEKTWLMQHAAAVLYPSLYEGFGLVPFEAALAGVPCMFAPWSSLATVAPAGSAAILPWDPAASASALHELLSDEQARHDHVAALASAARELTWSRAAAATASIYREAIAGPVRVAATATRDAAARERELLRAHRADVEMLERERDKVLREHEERIEALGPGRGLVGVEGSLPDGVQRLLLALSMRPLIGRPLFACIDRAYRAARDVARRGRGRQRL